MPLQGLREFERSLRAIDKAARTRVLPGSIAEGLDAIRSEVRATAPVGVTGELRNQITVDPPKAVKGRVAGAVSVNADHAAAIDLGTHAIQADKFIQRAVNRVGQRVADATARRIAAGIEAEGKG